MHEVFDPATLTWSTRAALPTPRGGFAAAVLNGRILIIGGEGANNTPGVFAENEEYDPVTDTWRTLSPMTTPRHSIQAGVIDGALRCFNTGGVDWLGRSMRKTVSVPRGKVQALWIGVDVLRVTSR